MAFPYPYPGPVAPLNNLPIEPQFYQPRFFFISAVTLGVTTLVTTTVNHDFVIGQTVRLLIPQPFGCRQLNNQQGNVLSIPVPNQVVVSINSTESDPFTSSSYTTQPQIIPIGDINSGVINSSGRSSTGTFIPGSFINISP